MALDKYGNIIQPWQDDHRLPTDDELRQLAIDMTTQHSGDRSQRLYVVSDKQPGWQDLVGLIAERELCYMRPGLPFPKKDKRGGDKGEDFYCDWGVIDVKGAQKPGNLINPVGKTRKDTIYILFGVNTDTLRGECKGFESGAEMMIRQPRAFGGDPTSLSNWIPAGLLHSIDYIPNIRSLEERGFNLFREIEESLGWE